MLDLGLLGASAPSPECARDSSTLQALVTEPALAMSLMMPIERRSAHAMDWSGLITSRTSAGGFPAHGMSTNQHSSCTRSTELLTSANKRANQLA